MEALTFTVPALALGVNLAILLLVGLARPLKGRAQLILVNLVVVVHESARLGEREDKVGLRRELVRVPCEVDVERRHSNLVLYRGRDGDDIDEAGVLLEEVGHKIPSRREVQPVEL